MDETLSKLIVALDELIEYCDDTDFEEAVAHLDQFTATCPKSGNNQQLEILAKGKYRLIEAFVDYGEPITAETHLADLYQLHKQTNNNAITQTYAEALVYLAGDAYLLEENENLDKARELHDMLKTLAREYPQCKLEESLMQALLDLVYYHLRKEEAKEAHRIFLEMNKFHLSYANSAHMTYLYARAFDYWIEHYIQQNNYESANKWLDALSQLPNHADESILRIISCQTEALVELNIKHKQIASAETLCASHRKWLPKETSERTMETIRERMGEILVALFNHYVLTKQMDAATLKYNELKELEADTQHPNIAECYARAVYAMGVYHANAYRFQEAMNYKNELERLLAQYERVKSKLTNYLATLLRGIASDSEEARESSFREEALRQLAYLIEREESSSVKYNYAVALADMVCIGIEKEHQTHRDHYLKELKKLTYNYPKISSLKEEYARALVSIADSLTEKDESLAFMQAAASLPQPWSATQFNHISRSLYNAIVNLGNDKDFVRAEQWHKLHTELMCHPDIPEDTAVRQAKQLYNLHYDYSDQGDFARAEEKYQALKALYKKYADISVEDSLLAQEVVKRLATATKNYAIDLRDKTPKKTFSLFSSPAKKSAQRIAGLLRDVSALVAEWKECPISEISDAYQAIKSIRL